MQYRRRATIYRAEYKEERDFYFLSSFIRTSGMSILEVPCGVGRLSVWLSGLVDELTIVDLESDMVSRAKEAIEKLDGDTTINAVVGDVRSLNLGQSFDLAIVPREALQLFSPIDGKQVLSSVSNHLKAGGVMIIDCATFNESQIGDNPDPDYFDPAGQKKEWKKNWTRALEDGSNRCLIRWSNQYDHGQILEFKFRYDIEQDGRCVERWSSGMNLYRYPLGWMVSNCPDGSVLQTLYGDYDKSPLEKDSLRMIGIFMKTS